MASGRSLQKRGLAVSRLLGRSTPRDEPQREDGEAAERDKPVLKASGAFDYTSPNEDRPECETRGDESHEPQPHASKSSSPGREVLSDHARPKVDGGLVPPTSRLERLSCRFSPWLRWASALGPRCRES